MTSIHPSETQVMFIQHKNYHHRYHRPHKHRHHLYRWMAHQQKLHLPYHIFRKKRNYKKEKKHLKILLLQHHLVYRRVFDVLPRKQTDVKRKSKKKRIITKISCNTQITNDSILCQWWRFLIFWLIVIIECWWALLYVLETISNYVFISIRRMRNCIS